jgi:peptidoglycan/xylan/chitin deacetylase (PgdA/CDA1 family)
MRIPGRRAIRDALRWGRSRPGWRAAILGYHRVSDDRWDPLDLALPPAWFAEHLRILRQRAQPMSLRELARAMAEGRRPQRAVVVTLDDGYVNTLEAAEPLLRRFEVPATLFVIAGTPGEEFWWDELTRLLRPGRELPNELRVGDAGQTFSWSVAATEDRRRATVEISRRLMVMSRDRIRGELDRLWDQIGGRTDESPEHCLMSVGELRRLAHDGLIEVGSHTRTHPVLPGRPLEEQRSEIFGSREMLRAATGQEVVSFSYPNGARAPETLDLVRQAGYFCACSSERDVVRRDADRWDLPRFWLPPCDGSRFSRWLDRWLV